MAVGVRDGDAEHRAHPAFRGLSFHNMYIELLFEGGAIKVGTYLILIAASAVLAKKNAAFAEAHLFRLFYLPLMISWLAFSIFEAGATPFSTTFFSFVMSVFLVVLPRCCAKGSESMRYRYLSTPSRDALVGARSMQDGW